MKKHMYTALAIGTSVLGFATLTSAHVVVTPNQVGIASTQTFSISVPSEKDGLSTTGLRLVLPDGLEDVMPTIQQGWKIETKKNELDWTAGTIPNGQRDDFTFRAQAPASVTTLNWKAYQIYSDGSIVAWDQTPVAGHADDDNMTPYSQTQVINDLTSSSSEKDTPIWLGTLTLILSLGAIVLAARPRK